VKLPGPDHPISIERNSRRVRIVKDGMIIASTLRALTMREATLRPVQYIPRDDADMSRLRRSTHTTYCPYKGDASYFDLLTANGAIANAVWTYEAPYPTVASIASHLAFYSNGVDAIEQRDD
jgi:uncharacterized protein (DUF427 family)